MSYVAVLPSIYPLWTERCLRSCAFADDILVVDNTVTNRGVSASWNLGIDRMLEQDADWLIIMSAALRFGDAGGQDFLDRLVERPGDIAVEAAHGIGWHLIAFNRFVFEAVGRFDENFYPAYWEDLDFGRRMRLQWRLEPPYWTKVSVDVAMAGWAHGHELGGVRINADTLREYWRRKWGEYPPDAIYDKPFGVRPLDWWEQPA